jgi:adenine-specific DNA-methyltransferase
LLNTEPSFKSANDKLLLENVLNKKNRSVLIKLLLSDNDFKREFFEEIDGILIFKKEDFTFYLTAKSYLEDLYTAFDNRIGFSNKKQLDDNVVLNFPYKDCILEGGQTKDDEKRKEIFFNEILAKDEINRLKEPKVLTNYSRYSLKDTDNKQRFNRNKNGTITDNLLIKGNNLLVLYSLLEEFRDKVKLIYIDPPYNTGGSGDTFKYNNTFNHSTWLCFMRNRIEIARELLKDDGFMVISIDHFELAYLVVLCDEIFGRENRIGIVSIIGKPGGRNQTKFFGPSNEFALFYTKNKVIADDFQKVILNEEKLKEFNLCDKNGKYKLNGFLRDHIDNLREKKPSFWYPIYCDKNLENISLEKFTDCIEILPISNSGREMSWKELPNSFLEEIKNDDVVIKKDGDRISINIKYREQQVIKTHWDDKRYNFANQGTKIIEKILNSRGIFPYAKPVPLIKDIIKLTTGKESIILDFFSGSGTTGHATLELNNEDGGNRQFILCEQMDYIENITKERLKKVIGKEIKKNDDMLSEVEFDNGAISKSVNWQGGGEFVYFELATYNEKFVKELEKAETKEEIIKIFNSISEKGFVKHNIDIKALKEDIDNNDGEFLKKDLGKMKKDIYNILNKNLLYIPLSMMDDIKFKVSDIDKKLTEDFYGLK